MKKLLLVVLALSFVFTVFTGCTPSNVKIGTEAILVKKMGSDRGIQPGTIPPGIIWTGPGTYVVAMPTITKSYPFTSDARPGSPDNEAVYPGDKNGTQFEINWALDGHIYPGASPVLYKKYMMDFEDLLHGPVRQNAERGWTQYSRNMDLADILGAGGTALLDSMTNYMKREMQFVEVDGKRVQVYQWERIYFLSTPKPLSEEVTTSIAAITSARNNFLAKVTNARADSTERVIVSGGIDESNKLLGAHLTPLIVEYKRAENWRPLAIGGSAIVNTGGK